MNDPTQDIKQFLGLHNKHAPRHLPWGAMVRADNIDIDDQNGVVRRRGYTRSTTQTKITASFSTQDERRLFIVENGDLYLVSQDMTSSLIKAAVGEQYIHWLEVADYIIMSSGHIIDVQNSVAAWRVERPPSPSVSIEQGSLLAGNYHVVTTYVDNTGREGGASDMVEVTVGDNSGLLVSTGSAPGLTPRIYVTATNGKVYYRVGEGSQALSISSMDGYTIPLDEVQLRADEVPEGVGALAFFESRLWACQISGDHSIIWYSQPFWWNLFDLYGSYLAVPGQVRMMVGTEQGLLIASGDEIYIYTREESLVRVAEYGVPAGVPYIVEDNGKVLMWTNQGLCEFAPFTNLTGGKVSVAPGSKAHVGHLVTEGYEKVVVLTDGQGRSDNQLGERR